ncbi:MAG: acylphosphatase, partial [Bacteroidetes bacterium]|nr:acylphosphatase [Bacteroidota bacterium]
MTTWHIHIKGVVQGVGFRPFVFLLAKQYELNGWVNNDVDGVHIEFNAEQPKAVAFKEAIELNPPSLARITSISLKKTHFQNFNQFEIIHSKKEGKANLLLTPDFALCSDCREEL